MVKNKTIIVASKNKKKSREITYLLEDFPITVKTLDDFVPIPVVEEDGRTFHENSYKKSNFTAKKLGLTAIADDSGLIVPALKGAPGVYSARYAGVGSTDTQKCNKLLQELEGYSDRSAYFQCVISISIPSGKLFTYEGKCDGFITNKMLGENGFGYDSIFFYDKLNKTFAQMSSKEKNSVSHRGIALKMLKKEFDKILSQID